MRDTDDLTIRDLEKLTGFSSRSIHHYISRGLIPNPEGKGPAARYGKEHLLRLRLIEQAEKAGFRIDQRLQEALDGLSVEEMEDLVEMAAGAAPEDIKTFGHWLMTGESEPVPSAAPRSPSDALSARMPATGEWLARHRLADQAPEAAGIERPAYRRETPRRSSSRRPERWERVRIGGVLELGWKQPRKDPQFRHKVEELLQYAERLFGRYDDEEGDF